MDYATIMGAVTAFRELLGRMAVAAERLADATVANNVQLLLVKHHAQGIGERLDALANDVHDIRDCYGKLITLQTSGVPPWHYRDQGHNVVDIRPVAQYKCESFTDGERCTLPAGHSGEHLVEKPEPPPIEMRNAPGAPPIP